MIAGIAVSAATFAIDKLYSYRIPQGMDLRPGCRVQVPFGRGNTDAEGIVVTVFQGPEEKLKTVLKNPASLQVNSLSAVATDDSYIENQLKEG